MKNIQDIIHAPGVSFIDVRSEMEFDMGHVDGAINIPLEQVVARKDEIEKLSTPRVLYCRSGNRSGMAVALLQQAGLTDLHNGGGVDLLKLMLQ